MKRVRHSHRVEGVNERLRGRKGGLFHAAENNVVTDGRITPEDVERARAAGRKALRRG